MYRYPSAGHNVVYLYAEDKRVRDLCADFARIPAGW